MKPRMVGRNSVRDIDSIYRNNAGLLDTARIMTLNGEKTVETLSPGDKIITRDGGTVVLKALRCLRVSGHSVGIKARALGHNRPERDVVVSAGLPILIRDWRAKALYGESQVLLPAARLVDGTHVTLQNEHELTTYELVFDSPHVLYVDGMEVASYIGKVSAEK